METLHVEVEGDDSQPTLLLLHGFLSCNLQWLPNRASLLPHFRLVQVELWGHGKSPAPQDPARYRVEGYLDEFERIRSALAVDRWIVCGQSFGAGFMIRYALARPEVVRGLVVTNSRSALNDMSRQAGADRDLAFYESIDARALPFHPCHARRFPPELKARLEEAADAIPPFAIWQAASAARDLSCRDVAAELRVPTLLVNGRYETVFQPDRDFAAATIPGIEIVDLDAGHSVNIEASEGFDTAVVGFAREHP